MLDTICCMSALSPAMAATIMETGLILVTMVGFAKARGDKAETPSAKKSLFIIGYRLRCYNITVRY